MLTGYMLHNIKTCNLLLVTQAKSYIRVCYRTSTARTLLQTEMIRMTMLRATPLLSVLLLLLASCGCTTSKEIALFKVTENHSDVLHKFQPSITDFSKSLTSELQGSSDMETMLNDVITKTLEGQMDKLPVATNGTFPPPDGMCCWCRVCFHQCWSCCRACCNRGGACGCTCLCCATGQKTTVSDLGTSAKTALILWGIRTKYIVRRDVSHVVSLTSRPNGLCCSCEQCLKKSDSDRCDGESCCTEGSECTCRRCGSDNFVLLASGINNPVVLTSEAETAVGRVESLVDSLLVLLSYE